MPPIFRVDRKMHRMLIALREGYEAGVTDLLLKDEMEVNRFHLDGRNITDFLKVIFIFNSYYFNVLHNDLSRILKQLKRGGYGSAKANMALPAPIAT